MNTYKLILISREDVKCNPVNGDVALFWQRRKRSRFIPGDLHSKLHENRAFPSCLASSFSKRGPLLSLSYNNEFICLQMEKRLKGFASALALEKRQN